MLPATGLTLKKIQNPDDKEFLGAYLFSPNLGKGLNIKTTLDIADALLTESAGI